MVSVANQPTNPNNFQQSKYQLTISRVPNFVYHCQTIDIPGLVVAEAPVPNPNIDLYVPGTKPIFEPLMFSFIVDEELKAWREIFDWMYMGSQDGRDKFFAQHPFNPLQTRSIYSDIILTVFSSKNKPTLRFQFQDAFPVMLGAIHFDTTMADTPVFTSDTTFRYTKYDFKSLV